MGDDQLQRSGIFHSGRSRRDSFYCHFPDVGTREKTGWTLLDFSNRTKKDIILRGEFTRLLGDRFINTITDEKVEGFDHQMIDEQYLKEKISNFDQNFYVCGPKPMIKDIRKHLESLGADVESVVFEK